MKQLTTDKVKQYQRDGYAVFNEIYDPETIRAVKQRMSEIVESIDVKKGDITNIAVFSTEDSNK